MAAADVPEGIDPNKPSIARIYDYALGGSHNFAVDRAEWDRLSAVWPALREQAVVIRAFLDRSVRFMAGSGIRQFLDLGSGIPTMNNVHDVATAVNPDSHVVYVDFDEVAVRHSRYILRGSSTATAVHADIRDPAAVLGAAEASKLIDFGQPVAVLAFNVLHFIEDDAEVAEVVGSYRDATVPGSHLALSHLSHGEQADTVEKFATTYSAATAPVLARSREQLLTLFDGYELVEPGLVRAHDWRPDPESDTGTTVALGGVGRIPG